MARLPIPGGDDDTWGTILNEYLTQAHNTDGSLKPAAVQSAAPDAGSSQPGMIQLANDLGGTAAAPVVTGIQDHPVASTTPAANDVLAYNAGTSQWEPTSTSMTYTDEQAQDAVGTILTDSSSVDFTYNDSTPGITAAVLPAGIDKNGLGGSALSVANGGTGAASLTSGSVVVGAGTGAVTASKAAPTGDFVGTTDTQALTNKTITDSTNNVTANGLRSATTTVGVSAATAPSSGQVLRATGGTAATWQDLSAANVSFSATGGVVATNVQAAIAEVDGDLTTHAGAADPHSAAKYAIMTNTGRHIYVGTESGTDTTGSQDGDIWIVTAA